MKFCMNCMEQYEDEYEICPYCGYIEGTVEEESYYMEPGSILNKHYIVGNVLGTGGFGTTYIGWDYELERKVAIKEYLPKEFSTRVKGMQDITIYPGEKEEQFQAGIQKFIEEARRLLKFKTVPGIVKFYNCFEENKTAYIIMEYLEGKTLKEYLTEGNTSQDPYRKLEYNEAKRIMDSLLDALQEIHKEGIIHRDIAPDNVFLTKEGEVKLIDFGASRFATTRHSRSLTVLIKEGYAPQEQYRSRGDQGPWTDLYSVAATFYTMVTGCVPQDAMEREGKDLLKRPSKLGIKGIPKNVENAVMNALNRKVEDRTQSCEEFKKQLSDENTKWNFVKQRKIDIGKWPLWAKIASGVGGAGVIAFIMLLITGIISFGSILSIFKPKSEVPFVVGDSKEVAEKTLEEAGFECVYANYVEDDTIAKDCIYNQLPGANAELKQGEPVYLSISCGSIKKQMPDVVGFDFETAKQMIEELGLTDLQIKMEPVSDAQQIAGAAENTVLRQLLSGNEIAEGTEVNNGMVLTLEVAAAGSYDSGQSVNMMNLIGQAFQEAKATAAQSAVTIRKIKLMYSDQPKNIILEQSVAEGESIAQGTIVDVTVSAGSDILVDRYLGKDKKEVTELLAKKSIKASWEEKESKNVPEGRIISQNIEPGQMMNYKTILKLVVSKGSKTVKIDKDKLEQIEKNVPEAMPTKPPKVSENSNAKSKKQDKANTGKKKNNTKEKAKPTAASSNSVPQTAAGVDIPNVTGQTLSEAGSVLVNSKLNYTSSYEFNASVVEGKIIRQSKTGKTTEGDTVNLVVSKGKQAPDGWTEETGFSSQWYSVETKEQYYEKSRTIEQYTEWGDTVKFTAKQKESDTLRYVKEVNEVTGSHEEWFLKRWWNGKNFKDSAGEEYSLDYTTGWYPVSQIWAAAGPPKWNYNRYHLSGDSENSYPYVHDGTRQVNEYTLYYYYQKGTRKAKKGNWGSEKWVDSKSKTTSSKEYACTKTRTVYKYTEK